MNSLDFMKFRKYTRNVYLDSVHIFQILNHFLPKKCRLNKLLHSKSFETILLHETCNPKVNRKPTKIFCLHLARQNHSNSWSPIIQITVSFLYVWPLENFSLQNDSFVKPFIVTQFIFLSEMHQCFTTSHGSTRKKSYNCVLLCKLYIQFSLSTKVTTLSVFIILGI